MCCAHMAFTHLEALITINLSFFNWRWRGSTDQVQQENYNGVSSEKSVVHTDLFFLIQ